MTEVTERHYLRRLFKPYTVYVAILAVITPVFGYMAVSKHDMQLWLPPAAMWVLIPISCGMDLKYRVYWTSAYIQMNAAGVSTRIFYDQITSVRSEVWGRNVPVDVRRPMRRISIYMKHARKAQAWVDVSLKHFQLEDIRQLLDEVHKHRPDLELPTPVIRDW